MDNLIALREIGVGLAAFVVFAWVLLKVIEKIRPATNGKHTNGTNGKAGDISVAAWEVKFAAMFEDNRTKMREKLDDHHSQVIRILDRIERGMEK